MTYLNFNDFERQLTRIEKGPPPTQPMDLVKSSMLADSSPLLLRCYSKVERILTKGPSAEVNVHDQLVSLVKERKTETRHELQGQYSFFGYANEYWLPHTAHLSPSHSKTRSLLQRLVSSENTLVKKPWTADNWSQGDWKVLQYIIDYDHHLLLWAVLNDDPAISKFVYPIF